ncbi:hypothetical protein CAC42_2384 [Sphaceloma murrayae]|uniref:Large ribosomal subunit protein mL67 n=1 Tax=Sphaceloma murrayae TaxID=2082308 RepID=A0A2K1QVW3_9PEZI|nr:hypothetical protein CAC42_2384 [Sphaceloma murrayae]
MKAGVLARRADVVAPHGTRIYAYRHWQTNRVLYSLSRSLDNTSSLKQLTFAGKKTVPRALRKDHWKPFFTAKFELPHQGLKAFKKLREWRILHELNWDPEAVKPLEYTIEKQEEKEDEYDEWNELGGWRVGGPRQRLSEWKLRKKKHIMNQAENSVADLAAVLMEQEKMAEGFSERMEGFAQEALSWVSTEATNDTARQEHLDRINKKLQRMEKRVKATKAKSGKRWDLSLAKKVQNLNFEIKRGKIEYHHVSKLPDKLRQAVTDTLSEKLSSDYSGILHEEITKSMRKKTGARMYLLSKALERLGVDKERLLMAKQEADAGRPELLDSIIMEVPATLDKLSEPPRELLDEDGEGPGGASATADDQVSENAVSWNSVPENDVNRMELAQHDVDISTQSKDDASRQGAGSALADVEVVEQTDNVQKYANPLQHEQRVPEQQDARAAAKAAQQALKARSAEIRLLALRLQSDAAITFSELQRRVVIRDRSAIQDRARARFEQLHQPQASDVIDSGVTEGEAKSNVTPSVMTLDVPVRGYGSIKVTRPVNDLVESSIDKLREQLPNLAPKPTEDVRLDIQIEWANPLDAEFGREWPSNVQHLPMGYSRNTSPTSHQRGVLELEMRVVHDKDHTLIRRLPDSSKDPKPRAEDTLRIQLAEELMRRNDSGIVMGRSAKKAVPSSRSSERTRAASLMKEKRRLAAVKVENEMLEFQKRQAAEAASAKQRKEDKRAEFIAKVEAEEPEKAAAIKRHWARVEELQLRKKEAMPKPTPEEEAERAKRLQRRLEARAVAQAKMAVIREQEQAREKQAFRERTAALQDLARQRKEEKRAAFIAKVEAEEPEKAAAIRAHWARKEQEREEKRAETEQKST